jgi:hypothetical protein
MINLISPRNSIPPNTTPLNNMPQIIREIKDIVLTKDKENALERQTIRPN